MLDEVNKAVTEYQAKWQKLTAQRTNKALFESARPTALGWKAADMAEFDKCFVELRGRSDQVHLKWLNERWIATIVLREPLAAWSVPVIKLMQRRPDSADALGLDHVDFYTPDVVDAAAMRTKEPGVKWTDEENGISKWLSLWFDGTEAKLRRESVLTVCIAEMTGVNKRILDRP